MAQETTQSYGHGKRLSLGGDVVPKQVSRERRRAFQVKEGARAKALSWEKQGMLGKCPVLMD